MDRSTKATLSTYNTWIQLGRLQKIYHFHCPKWLFTAEAVASSSSLNAEPQRLRGGSYSGCSPGASVLGQREGGRNPGIPPLRR